MMNVMVEVICTSPAFWYTERPVPEEENAEGHSDRIPLSANPDGLQDARVF